MSKASVRPIPRLIALAVASLALSACGGGGGGGNDEGGGAVGPQSIAGKVVDGYVAGATVTCLFGGTVRATTISDANGAFAFTLPAGQSCDTIESRGGVDIGITPNDPSDDIVRPAGVLRAPVPAGATTLANLTVTPLSTLMQSLVASGKTQAEAANTVRTQLGLSSSIDPLAADPTTDIALYKAAGVVAQIIDQVSAALAAAGGVTSDAGAQALANAAINALAASLAQGTTLAQLTAAPDSLTPTSPLVAIIAQATQTAKSDAAVAAQLATVQPETLSLLAAPLVASATKSIGDAASVQQAIDQAGTLANNDTTATVIASLSDVLDTAPGTGEQQAILDDLAAAAAAAASGTTTVASVTVGGTTTNATVPAGLSNFAQLLNDTLNLYGPVGTPVPVTLSQYSSSSGVAIAQNLSKVGFALVQSADATQLSTSREAPLAIEVTDGTRTFQAIVDRVTLTQVGNQVVASVPSGAKLTVYGKTASAETTSPFEVTLTTDELPIVSTSAGEIRVDLDKLFGVIGNAAANGSALDQLATNRVSGGTYTVTVVLGELRIARATSAVDPTPRLASAYTVTLGAGARAVSGYGVRGKVTVGG